MSLLSKLWACISRDSKRQDTFDITSRANQNRKLPKSSLSPKQYRSLLGIPLSADDKLDGKFVKPTTTKSQRRDEG